MFKQGKANLSNYLDAKIVMIGIFLPGSFRWIALLTPRLTTGVSSDGGVTTASVQTSVRRRRSLSLKTRRTKRFGCASDAATDFEWNRS